MLHFQQSPHRKGSYAAAYAGPVVRRALGRAYDWALDPDLTIHVVDVRVLDDPQEVPGLSQHIGRHDTILHGIVQHHAFRMLVDRLIAIVDVLVGTGGPHCVTFLCTNGSHRSVGLSELFAKFMAKFPSIPVTVVTVSCMAVSQHGLANARRTAGVATSLVRFQRICKSSAFLTGCLRPA
eukprot:6489275-Amphidinium_carterae.2